MSDLGEVFAVWRGEVNRAIRSGRMVVLLVLFVLFTSLVLGSIGAGVRAVTSKTDEAVAAAISRGADPAEAAKQLRAEKKRYLSWIITDEAYLDAVADAPLVLLAAFKLLTWFVPFFVALMGFDQLSGEVGPKSIRFLVVRVRRSSIFLGKYLAQASMLAVMLLISALLMALVTRAFSNDIPWGVLFGWTGKLCLASLMLGVMWSSLTALFSSLFKTPGVSLVVNIIAIMALAFISNIGGWFRFPGEEAKGIIDQLASDESWVAYMRYASVWHFGQNLIHPVFKQFAAAVLIHLGWALAFVGVAELTLARRDL